MRVGRGKGKQRRNERGDVFLGPPGVGKTHLAQTIGYEGIHQKFLVLYRSIFDLVRDFMKDEAFTSRTEPCGVTSTQSF